jgi:hypothetical protein
VKSKFFTALSVFIFLACRISFAGPVILITEVFYDTPGTESKEEWIELYNPNAFAVDLTGYTLSDNRSTMVFPAGIVLPATGAVVLARNAAGFQDLFHFQPDLAFLSLSLNNSGDILELTDATDILDFVAWEGFVPGWTISAEAGESISRISTATHPDSWAGQQIPNPGIVNLGSLPAPIPEPSTMVLLGFGAVLIMIRCRKKR